MNVFQMYLLAVPGEFTTMAGRRLRETVQTAVESLGKFFFFSD